MRFTDSNIARVVQAQVAADAWKRQQVQRSLSSRQRATSYRARLIASGIIKINKGGVK